MNIAYQPLHNNIHKLIRTVEALRKRLEAVDLIDSVWIDLDKVESDCLTLIANDFDTSNTDLLPSCRNLGGMAKSSAIKIMGLLNDSDITTRAMADEFADRATQIIDTARIAEENITRQALASLNSEISSMKRELNQISADHKNQILHAAEELKNTRLKLAEVEQEIIDLNRLAENEALNARNALKEAKQYLTEKRKEVDDLVEDTASEIIASDYKQSAAAEKKIADYFRYGAIACMAVIFLIITDATLSTLSADFDWHKTLTRVMLVFLLSVPAAYLARESAKHREQQYNFHQTSLDTKAISPFISTLPEDEQHKIKSVLAAKLFAGRDFSKVGNDPFPVNTHELLMELLKKVDISPKNKKD